ncbi:MAG: peptidoglycan DD-metalloendopeptidase family protein [Alphaproteobacteria bacterium]
MADRRRRAVPKAAAALAVLGCLLAGCGFLSVPAQRSAAPAPPPAAPAAAAAAGAPDTVIVQPGDSVYSLARRNHAPIRSIIEANHLEAPYVLRPGQQLLVPHPQVHVVEAGDTLYGVAQRHSVDASELVRVNGLTPPYRLILGQLLILPGKVTSEQPAAPAAAQADVRHVELLPPPPPAAAEGATAGAPLPPTAAEEIAASTNQGSGKGGVTAVPLAPPQAPGQTTGAAALPSTAAAAPALPPAAAGAKPALPEVDEEDVSEPAAAPLTPPVPPGAKVAALTPPGAVPAGPGGASGGRFFWPVHGKIVSPYGAKEGGLFNDGINIAVKEGTGVAAADDGIVVYAGNEIRGFGNLVLVKHANGWMTAYAHNAALLVKRGEQVRRGQAIARAGSSGNVPTPQLHFEIRRGSHPVDPMKYLAALSS